MPEYIDRDAFIKRLENEADRSSDIINLLILNGIANIVRDENIAPAEDVVEIVRCSECKYFGKELKQGKHSCLNYQLPYCLENDYCGYGERKDGDE